MDGTGAEKPRLPVRRHLPQVPRLNDADYYLAECVSAAGTFIEKSGYTIYKSGSTPYLNLFSSINAISSEIILARAFNTAIGLKHDVNGYLTGTTMGRPGLLKNVANMYLMKDGTPFTSQPGWETMQLPDESKNRDGRFAQTVRTPGYKRIDDDKESAPQPGRDHDRLPAGEVPATGQIRRLPGFDQRHAAFPYGRSLPQLRRSQSRAGHADAGRPRQDDQAAARTRRAWPTSRWSGPTPIPTPTWHRPRRGYANVTGANKGVILEIRRERTVELLMENFRYWDIMRWKEGKRFEKPFEGLYFPGVGS